MVNIFLSSTSLSFFPFFKITIIIINIVIISDGGVSVTGPDKCCDRFMVSSNEYRKIRLTDSDFSSFWESSGTGGEHWIRLYMRKDIVIRYLK